MQTEVPPKSVSDILPFRASLLAEGKKWNTSSCKISKDGQLVWIVKGCSLHVYSLRHTQLQCLWSYRIEPRDPSIQIGKVAEFPQSGEALYPHLLFVLDGINMLCLLDVSSSKVVRAVQLPGKITTIETIASEGGPCPQNRPLARELRYAFGLVAVGLEGGLVVLVDLVLDEDRYYSCETNPGEARAITLQAADLASIREAAIIERQHLVFTLNDESFHQGSFVFRSTDTGLLSVIRSDKFILTSMMYIPHLTVLALGFNFGGFQLWNLHKLLIEYTLPVTVPLEPVVYLAFQEPENDPRNYCYLWVARGQVDGREINPALLSTASLFSLGYSKKEWVEDYGFLYQDMHSCVHRFDHYLTTEPLKSNEVPDVGSRVIAFQSIQQSEILGFPRPDLDELQNEDLNAPDLSLCVMVWEAWSTNNPSSFFLTVFDLNQWYQAQMPSQIRATKGHHSSYMGVFSLSQVQSKLEDNNIIDFHVIMSSITKHKLFSGGDEMYFPSSLAFDAKCFTDTGIIKISYLGQQQQLLWEIEALGPSCLSNPNDIYNYCVEAGLLSRSTSVSSNITLKREALLTLALDHHNVSFVTACAMQWSTTDDPKVGCTVKFLLCWLWKRVGHIKNTSDRICVPLFNCSGRELDPNSLTLLQRHATQLELISLVLKAMQTHPVTELGLQELNIRLEVTQLLSTYMKAVLWLRYCSLLPEHAEGEAYGENEVAYPVSFLQEAYNNRRKELQQIHSAVGQTELLMIDGMISRLWESVSSHCEKTGYMHSYPPQSFHSVLTTYLMKGPLLQDKHCILLYLLLDMASFLSKRQSHLEEKLMQFPVVFQISHSRVKLTQGFWMLDHKDFEEAIDFFTDPVINFGDIQQWQHIRIIKSFLFQGESQKALRYIHICKPQMRSPEEVKLQLSVLLANKLVAQAIEYQRQSCDDKNSEDLLTHFFNGCQQTGCMETMLKLCFSPTEEESLLKFLLGSPESLNKDILFMYLLQQGKILEASRINDNLTPSIMENDSKTKTRVSKRNTLISAYMNTLPSVQIKLAAEIERHKHRMNFNPRKGPNPTPLSTTIRSNSGKVVSDASRLLELMAKVKETWMCPPISQQSPLRTTDKALVECSNTESVPFIYTLSAQKRDPRRESEIVYATPVGKRTSNFLESTDSSTKMVPHKKSRVSDCGQSVLADIERSKGNRPVSADIIALLQTPPVQRKVPLMKPSLAEPMEVTGTPPSILKLRPSVNRAVTPVSYKYTSYAGPSRKDQAASRFKADLKATKRDDDDSLLQLSLPKSFQDRLPSSTSSTVESDFSSTPKKEYEEVFNSPRDSSLSSWRGFNRNISMHNSDNIVIEDEDITVNFSIQKRRDLGGKKENGSGSKEVLSAMDECVAEDDQEPLTLESEDDEEPLTLESEDDEESPFLQEKEPIGNLSLNRSPISGKPELDANPFQMLSKPISPESSTLLKETYLQPTSSTLGNQDGHARLSQVFKSVDRIPRSPIGRAQLTFALECASKSFSGTQGIRIAGQSPLSDGTQQSTVLDGSQRKAQTPVFGSTQQTPQTPLFGGTQQNNLSAQSLIFGGTQRTPETLVFGSTHRVAQTPIFSGTQQTKPSSQSSIFGGTQRTPETPVFGSTEQAAQTPLFVGTQLSAQNPVSALADITIATPLFKILPQKSTGKSSPAVINQRVLSEAFNQASQSISNQESFSFQNPTVCPETPNQFLETGDTWEIPSFSFNLPNLHSEVELLEKQTPPRMDVTMDTKSHTEPQKESPETMGGFSPQRLQLSNDESDNDEGINDVLEIRPHKDTFTVSPKNFDTLTKSDTSVTSRSIAAESMQRDNFAQGSIFSISSLVAKNSSLDKSEVQDNEELYLSASSNNSSASPSKSEMLQISDQEHSTDRSAEIKAAARRELFIDTVSETIASRHTGEVSPISSVYSKSSQSILNVSMSESVQSDASVFITPEKVTQSPPLVWSERLRRRSRSTSVASSESSPPNVRRESTKTKTSKTKEPRRKAVPTPDLDTAVKAPQTILEDDSELLDEKDATPKALPFVFSPPSTRSKSRRKKLSDSGAGLSKTDVLDTQMTRKPITRSRSSVANPAPPWETLINVITPGPPVARERKLRPRSSRSSVSSEVTTNQSTTTQKGGPFSRKKVKL